MKKKALTISALLLSAIVSAGCTTAIETSVQRSEQPQQAAQLADGKDVLKAGQSLQPENGQSQQSPTDTTQQPSANSEQASGQAVSQMGKAVPPVASVTSAKYYVDNKVFLIRPADAASTEKITLLTFDDGPKGDSTLKLLDTLDKYNAKAIWFISGFNYGSEYKANPAKAEKFKQLVLEIKKRGHVIGSHTWEHYNLKQIPADKQRKEINEMNNLLESITGEKPRFLRPPFGSYTDVLKEETKKQGMQWMNWSVGSLDWEHRDPQKVVQQTVSTIHNGANILMHDNDVEVQALEGILKELSAKGYKFVVPTEVRSE